MLRIFFVFLSCMIVYGLRSTVNADPLLKIANTLPDLARIIHYWITYGLYLIALCTEEISLAILVPDFRRNISQRFRTIFCKKSNVIGVQQEQRNINTYLDPSNKMNN